MSYSETRRIDSDAQGDPSALGWLVAPGTRVVNAAGDHVATIVEPIRYGGKADLLAQLGDWQIEPPKRGEQLVADWFAAIPQLLSSGEWTHAEFIRLEDGWFPHEPPMVATAGTYRLGVA